MSRIVEELIMVTPNAKGLPEKFSWRRQWRKIATILEEWRDTGCWWDNEGEKVFYRLRAADAGVYELYCDLRQKQWYLYRVLD